MRLRLLIPAAMAAVATYAALVRDETRPAEAWTPTVPTGHGPTDVHVPRASIPAMPAAEPVVAVATSPAPPEPPAAPSAPASICVELAPSETPAVQRPSVYDLLAGEPGAQAPAGPPIASPTAPTATPRREAPSMAPAAPSVADAEVKSPAVEAGDTAPAESSVPAGAPETAPGAAPELASTVIEEGRFALGGYAAGSGHSVVSAVTFRRRLPTAPAAEDVVLTMDAAENVIDGGLTVLADPGFAPDRDGFTLLLAAYDPGPFSAAGSYRVVARP